MGEAEELTKSCLASDLSREVNKGAKCETYSFLTNQDPLIDSIVMLRALQEALEKEVQKFGEVGNNFTSLLYHPGNDDCKPVDIASVKVGVNEVNPTAQTGSGRVTSALSSLQTRGLSPKDDAKLLEVKLKHINGMLQKKESRIAELESTLSIINSRKEECREAVEPNHEKWGKAEMELEYLFKQRIEMEVEYLAITMMIQKSRLAASDEKDSLARKQERSKLETAKKKACMLEKKVMKLKTYRENIMEKEKVSKSQRKVCKATLCVFMQLSLLVYLWLFILQLTPCSNVIVPT